MTGHLICVQDMLVLFYLCLHSEMIDWGCLETSLESQKYLQLFFFTLPVFWILQWPRQKRNFSRKSTVLWLFLIRQNLPLLKAREGASCLFSVLSFCVLLITFFLTNICYKARSFLCWQFTINRENGNLGPPSGKVWSSSENIPWHLS